MNAKRNGKGDGFEGQSYVLRQLSIENALLGILGISISFRNYEENYLYSRIVECFSFRTKFYLCGEQLNTEILATPKLAEHEIRTLMRKKLASFQEMYLERISSVLINQLPQYTTNFYVCLLYDYFIHTFD